MATAKSRGAASKSPASKSASNSSNRGGSGASKGGSSKNAASKKSVADKKSAPAKKAAGSAKKSAAPAKSSAPARSGSGSSASRNGSTSASALGRGRSTSVASGRGASASRTKGGAKPAADPRNDLAKILEDLMKDIYYAEKKLVKALGKMAKNATDPKLKEAFITHQGQTEEQVSKLEQAFEAAGFKAKAKKCAAMDGLLEEADEHIAEYEKGAGLDAAMIVGAQKVEHYEIAAYGSMRSIAKTLGFTDAARIFEEIREQESDTDELLTTIAESVVNLTAEEETENVSGNDGGSNSASKGGARSATDSNAENDGAGRGISATTDGNERGEGSQTGEAMGH